MKNNHKFDLYDEITSRIIAELESGCIPWKKPWSGAADGAISHVTGRPYSLINQFLLREPGEYITFKQCQEEGGKVKKGAKSHIVVFWKVYPVERKSSTGEAAKDEDGNTIIDTRPVLRYYNVFHVNDCEGITTRYENIPKASVDPDLLAQTVLDNYLQREHIRFENVLGDRAYYSPGKDMIRLPKMDQFDNTAEYYSTAYHEATHSTGHMMRLARFGTGLASVAFGSESYSKEELVAEIGAAASMHRLGLETPSTFKNSAAYIQSWLNAIRNDKYLVVSAAGKAEKAVNFIFDTQPA